MSGLKVNILQHTLKAFKGDLKPVLCVDNDKAGQEFKHALEGQGIAFQECSPKEQYKDWNEQLKNKS